MNNKIVLWGKRIGYDIISFIVPFLALPVQWTVDLCEKYKSRQKSFDNTDDMYKEGDRLTELAKESIVTLSTMRHRDTTNKVKKHDEYYLNLYEKMIFAGETNEVKVTRYLNLEDKRKCTEARSLNYLTNPDNCSIYHTSTPIEMVLIDKSEALIGFPDGDNNLSYGFTFNNPSACEKLQVWHTTIGTQTNKITNQHKGGCLCQIDSWLNESDDYSMRLVNGFDSMASWYDNIYDRKKYSKWLSQTIDKVKEKIPEQDGSFRVLDLGCGTAFDASIFNEKGFHYTGVDISEGMPVKARQNTDPTDSTFVNDEITHFLFGERESRKQRKKTEQFDLILLLGNSFDYILGEFHKELVLMLISSSLKPGGVIIFSGSKIPLVHKRGDNRTLYNSDADADADADGDSYNIEVTDSKGEYRLINVTNSTDSSKLEFILHPTDYIWVARVLKKRDFRRLELGAFPSDIGFNYVINAFQKHI